MLNQKPVVDDAFSQLTHLHPVVLSTSAGANWDKNEGTPGSFPQARD